MYTKQQLEAYKKRIHYTGDLTVSKDTLDALIYTHQCGIPYENLDVCDFHREILLDENSLFEKMVDRKRGGYCLEMNGFFCRILQSVGFDARPCLCRVMFGVENPGDNCIDHRSTIVTLDGQRYLCDVGIGGAMPSKALPLTPENCWQELRGEYFCIKSIERNWYGVFRRASVSQDIQDDPMNRRERLEWIFCDAAAHEIDFISVNYYLSQSDESKFRHTRMANIRTPEGYRALTNRTYREVIRGRRTERELSYEEIPIVLREKFGIEVCEDLRF
ncbi:MAG: arylamine N-acetyltransferase [Clostridiales bacterium]|nr:arylamine N-acetyltransferase [Clostridiales bacterium]